MSQPITASFTARSLRATEFGLSRSTVPEQDARAVLAMVGSMDLGAALSRGLGTERANMIDLYTKARRDPSVLTHVICDEGEARPASLTQLARTHVWLGAPVFDCDELTCLEFAARNLHAARQPWPQTDREFEELNRWQDDHAVPALVAELLTFSARQTQFRRFEAQTRLNLLSASPPASPTPRRRLGELGSWVRIVTFWCRWYRASCKKCSKPRWMRACRPASMSARRSAWATAAATTSAA